MNTTSVNLKLLREDLGLSQRDFAKKLMLSDATISRIEKGERNVTVRVLNQICKEFNVNKNWLITGEGSMYNNVDDLDVASMMGKIFAEEDEFLKKVFLTFAKLSDSERAVIMKVINELSNK